MLVGKTRHLYLFFAVIVDSGWSGVHTDRVRFGRKMTQGGAFKAMSVVHAETKTGL